MADVTADQINSLTQSINALSSQIKGGGGGGGLVGGGGGGGTSSAMAALTGSLNVVSAGATSAANIIKSAFNTATPDANAFAGFITKSLPEAIGEPAKAFAGVIQQQVGEFRKLSGAGIDFGGSLFTLTARVTESGLPFEVFTKTVAAKSNVLSQAFGTAEEGASMFAKVSGKFMADSGSQMARLGFSMDELAENNSTYIEILNRSGNLQGKSTEQLAAGAANYNLELDKLSKATGISRKQLNEANEAAARDLRMKLSMQALNAKDPAMAAEVQAKIEELKKADPSGKLAAGFVDMISGGGRALTKEAQNFALAMQKSGVDAASMTRGIYQGNADAVKSMNSSFDKAAQSGRNLDESTRTVAAVSLTMGRENAVTARAAFGSLRTSSERAAKQAEEDQKKIKDQKDIASRNAAEMDYKLTDAQNKFRQGLIETPLMETAAQGLNLGAEYAQKAGEEFLQMGDKGKMTMVTLGIALESIMATVTSSALAGKVVGAGLVGKAAVDAMKNYKSVAEAEKALAGTAKPATAAAKAAEKELPAAEKAVSKLGKKWLVPILAATGVITYVLWPEDKPPEILPTPEGPQPAGGNVPASMRLDLSNLSMPDNVSESISASVVKLKDLNNEIKITTSSFKDLDNISLTNLNSNLGQLNETLKSMKENMQGQPGKENTSSAQTDTNTAMLDRLDQLNNSMMAMVNHQSDAVDFLSKTAKNTRNSVGNMLG